MAQAKQKQKFRLSPAALDNLLTYVRGIRQNYIQWTDFAGKLEIIDKAYARYRQVETEGGVDVAAGDVACSTNKELIFPVTVAQVDSYVGYLVDIFCSGYPIFPVVSPPSKRAEAESLQNIIDDHAMRGRYVREIMLNIFDAAKYNLTAAEVDWCPVDGYSIPSAYERVMQDKEGAGTQLLSINRVNRISPYNLILDRRIQNPVDIPARGEYSGFVEALSTIELARRANYYKFTGNHYNTNAIFKSGNISCAEGNLFVLGCYRESPQISNTLVAPSLRTAGINWDAWIGATKPGVNKPEFYNSLHESVTLYVRIIPKHLGIYNEDSHMPQVWKLVILNDRHILYAARVYSIYDTLPIYIGQIKEDGFGYQTVSVGESSVDYQEAASRLYAIRENSARRAVMDRALYDPLLINPSHLDNSMVAPKIPIRDRGLNSNVKIGEAYHQIPFDSRGTETVIQDMSLLLNIADNLNGTNKPIQGQFQQGNKTRKEWNDTMEGAQNRMRLSALSLEMQFFLPIKEQIKLNIFQHGVEGQYQNYQTGEMSNIDSAMMESIRNNIRLFQIADGFHPAEKLASSDVLTSGMTLLGNSPVLQADLQVGGPLSKMFVHLMSLGGVKGMDQYLAGMTGSAPQGQPAVPPQGAE